LAIVEQSLVIAELRGGAGVARRVPLQYVEATSEGEREIDALRRRDVRSAS
jgi:hypothetical protein